ncbi:MAG: hypothetical protein J5697_02500, partial [Clostridia bacterium]|nr:hypothetical protein [Clostridia bacterium]
MTINAKKKNLLLKLAVFLTAAFLLPCFFILFGDSGKKIVRADDPIQTYDIRSAEEFISYSRAYAAGGKNPKDVLNISINSGSEISGDGFVSLGTLSRPFAGTINVPSVGINKFRLYNCPLFNYVSTDAKITGLGTVQIIRHKPNETPAEGVLTSGALFANHVVPGTNDANWSVSLLTFEGEGDPATEYAGVIGEIADGATVTVSFTNATNLAVVGTGDTGLICGKLGAGATLDVTTAGSGGNLTVTASSGNAGSLVGKMESGSTLKFSSANNTRVNSVNSSAGYAGGVVGYADNVTIGYKAGVTDYTVSGTITGSTGAGGLFGYYKNTGASVTFDMEDTFAITDGTTVTSSGVTGGVFGRLENTGASFTFDGNSSSEDITVSLTGGSFRGGVCGEYIASALTNAFEITDTETALTVSGSGTFGGLIGKITDSPAYVKIHDVSCTAASGSLNGGLIGTIGSGGSFIDATGNITVSGTMDAGLIANMPQGVLRLSGVFDLSGFVKADADSGELVKSRNRALIYATGDGKGTNGNWTYKRGENQNVDDISGWGQVIRCDGTTLKESDLFTVDMTAHTVTVAAAVTSMATVTDFAKTALNIKLNTGAGVGALKFTSGSANLSSTLLAGTLSVSADISLAGTGLTGLTRDDGANAAFSGTFNGNNKTITFATGESYGLKGNGSALDANTNQGRIFQHLYNGLFAKTSNATVSGLTVSGTFKVCQTKTDMRIGGVAAFAQNGLTLTNVNSSINIAAKHGGDLAAHIGGVVGSAASDGLNISVTGGNIHPVYTDQSAANGSSYVGGAIGTVFGNEESSITQAISFTSCDLGLDY